MEQLPHDDESEDDRTRRVLRVVQGPDWDFLQSLTKIVDNPYYTPSGRPHGFTEPHVIEIPPPTIIKPPDYDQPNSDALAA